MFAARCMIATGMLLASFASFADTPNYTLCVANWTDKTIVVTYSGNDIATTSGGQGPVTIQNLFETAGNCKEIGKYNMTSNQSNKLVINLLSKDSAAKNCTINAEIDPKSNAISFYPDKNGCIPGSQNYDRSNDKAYVAISEK